MTVGILRTALPLGSSGLTPLCSILFRLFLLPGMLPPSPPLPLKGQGQRPSLKETCPPYCPARINFFVSVPPYNSVYSAVNSSYLSWPILTCAGPKLPHGPLGVPWEQDHSVFIFINLLFPGPTRESSRGSMNFLIYAVPPRFLPTSILADFPPGLTRIKITCWKGRDPGRSREKPWPLVIKIFLKLSPRHKRPLGWLLHKGDSSEQCSHPLVCPFKTCQDDSRSRLIGGLLLPPLISAAHAARVVFRKPVWSRFPAVSPSAARPCARWAGVLGDLRASHAWRPHLPGAHCSAVFRPLRAAVHSQYALHLPASGIHSGSSSRRRSSP